MNVLDMKIRVEMNHRGGIVFHIPKNKKNDGFPIWETVGNGWAFGCASKGEWKTGFERPIDALWAGMKWNPTVDISDTLIDREIKIEQNIPWLSC